MYFRPVTQERASRLSLLRKMEHEVTAFICYALQVCVQSQTLLGMVQAVTYKPTALNALYCRASTQFNSPILAVHGSKEALEVSWINKTSLSGS